MSLVVKYIKGRTPLMKDLEGDANVESDCEEGVPGVKCELRDPEGGEETRAVLITGSSSAYVHFDISSFSQEKRCVFQLEIPFLLLLHRYDLVRTPQVAGS